MEIAQIVFSSVLLVFVLNLDQPSTHIYLNYVKANQKFRMFFRLTYTDLANIGPQDVSKTSPSNVPRAFPKDPIWPSWRRPNLTFKGRPWEIGSECPQDVLRTSSRGFKLRVLKLACPSTFFVNFSYKIYSIDQIYLKAFQHSRCTENPVKLLRWRIFCKIS